MDEFVVKIAPKLAGKKNCVFKLHKDDKISWNEAKMRRENEYQPWQIKLGSGRAARRFRAIKEGGVGENASYFIFYKPADSNDIYEVCSIDDWYSVSATQRYKTLTAEEAEQKFERRHKTLNYFSVMKRNGDAGEEGSFGDSKSFKVSELDDWEESGDDIGGSDEDNLGEDGESKKKIRKKLIKKEKDEADDAPEEGKEDSDEGDFEQREVDYMSDSSSSSSEAEEGGSDEVNVKGIAEEEALRDLLSTDDEEEINSPQKSAKMNMNKNSLATPVVKQDPDADESDDSSDSEDYDVDEDKMDSLFMKKSLPVQLVKQEQGSQDSVDATPSTTNIPSAQIRPNNATTIATTSSGKRKVPSESAPTISVSSSTSSTPGSQEKMIEDLVKKYLRRKPTPTRVLLKDIKSKLKRTGAATSDMDNNLVQTIAEIIKRLDPIKQKINDTIYFSLQS